MRCVSTIVRTVLRVRNLYLSDAKDVRAVFFCFFFLKSRRRTYSVHIPLASTSLNPLLVSLTCLWPCWR
jgi:hypothetical protein